MENPKGTAACSYQGERPKVSHPPWPWGHFCPVEQNISLFQWNNHFNSHPVKAARVCWVGTCAVYFRKKFHQSGDNIKMLLILGKYFSSLEISFTRTCYSPMAQMNETFCVCKWHRIGMLDNIAEMAFTANLKVEFETAPFPQSQLPSTDNNVLRKAPLPPFTLRTGDAHWAWLRGLSKHPEKTTVPPCPSGLHWKSLPLWVGFPVAPVLKWRDFYKWIPHTLASGESLLCPRSTQLWAVRCCWSVRWRWDSDTWGWVGLRSLVGSLEA